MQTTDFSAETLRHNLIRLGQETFDFLVIGGGTNRALVQGLLEEVEKGMIGLNDVQIGSLRLSSGNLVPRYFGLPHEPLEGWTNYGRVGTIRTRPRRHQTLEGQTSQANASEHLNSSPLPEMEKCCLAAEYVISTRAETGRRDGGGK